MLAFHGALPRRIARLTVSVTCAKVTPMTEAAAPNLVRHDMAPWRSIGIFGGLTVDDR